MKIIHVGITLCMVLVTGCQTTGKRDSSGQLMSLSAAKTVPLEQADLNLPRFLSIDGVVIERTIRDNGTAIIDRYKVNGKILAKSERLVDDNWFNEGTQGIVGDPGYLKTLLKSRSKRFGAENPQTAPAHKTGKTIGHYSINGSCQAFAVGYKLRVGALYDNDPGNIDTVVTFAGCNSLVENVQSTITKLGRPTDSDRALMAMRGQNSRRQQASNTSTGTKPKSSLASDQQAVGQRRSIAVEWQGVAPLIAGEVVLQKATGELALSLPNRQGDCTGSYIVNDKREGTGVWSVSCSNGLSALGTFTAYGKGKGASGEGRDNQGREVKYTIAGTTNR